LLVCRVASCENTWIMDYMTVASQNSSYSQVAYKSSSRIYVPFTCHICVSPAATHIVHIHQLIFSYTVAVVQIRVRKRFDPGGIVFRLLLDRSCQSCFKVHPTYRLAFPVSTTMSMSCRQPITSNMLTLQH